MLRYVGVTGFTQRAQVERALAHLPKDSGRRLMVGVLASGKSLRGAPLKPEWCSRTPRTEEIAGIFRRDERTLNLVHFAPGDEHRESLVHDLERLADEVGPALDGFQLNVAWPEEAMLGAYREDRAYRRHTIILQIGRAAIGRMDGWPTAVAKRACQYGGLIDGVLVDASGGRGEPFDLEPSRAILSAIVERHPEYALGIAGGLDADALARLEPLVAEFPQLSVDAESRLRTPEGALDDAAVEAYLGVALAMLR